MHELSVCLSLLREVERIARENDAGRVTKIAVTVGPLSGVEPELLQRAYPLAVAGTIAEHAEFHIDVAGIVVKCSQCGAESAAKPNRLLCGECGDYRTNLVSGDEMVLKSLELDDIGTATAD
jgi:hydrogenase nickel incorporation protein HypA/HybF